MLNKELRCDFWGELLGTFILVFFGGFFSVYILAPILGGVTASVLFSKILTPLWEKKEAKSQKSEIC